MIYHLVMTNIAMERSTIFKNGKPSISMGHLYHGYVKELDDIDDITMISPKNRWNSNHRFAGLFTSRILVFLENFITSRPVNLLEWKTSGSQQKAYLKLTLMEHHWNIFLGLEHDHHNWQKPFSINKNWTENWPNWPMVSSKSWDHLVWLRWILMEPWGQTWDEHLKELTHVSMMRVLSQSHIPQNAYHIYHIYIYLAKNAYEKCISNILKVPYININAYCTYCTSQYPVDNFTSIDPSLHRSITAGNPTIRCP